MYFNFYLLLYRVFYQKNSKIGYSYYQDFSQVYCIEILKKIHTQQNSNFGLTEILIVIVISVLCPF